MTDNITENSRSSVKWSGSSRSMTNSCRFVSISGFIKSNNLVNTAWPLQVSTLSFNKNEPLFLNGLSFLFFFFKLKIIFNSFFFWSADCKLIHFVWVMWTFLTRACSFPHLTLLILNWYWNVSARRNSRFPSAQFFFSGIFFFFNNLSGQLVYRNCNVFSVVLHIFSIRTNYRITES